MVDRFFDHYYRRRPVNATFTGVHEFDRLLPDWSPEGLEACAADMRAVRDDLGRALRAGVTPRYPDRVDMELASDVLEVQLAELDTAHSQRGNPALFTGDAIFGVVGLVTRDFAPLADRLAAAADRMDAIPPFLGQARRALGHRAVPGLWLRRALRECEGASVLFGRGLEILRSEARLDAALDGRVAAAAGRAREAFAGFAHWLRRDVEEAPAAALACGPDLFDRLLARGHRIGRPRQGLLSEARAQLQEATARLREAARAVDPGGWPAVQATLATDHPTEGDYLATFQRTWEACRAHAVEQRLLTWPDSPIRFVPIPRHTRDAAPFLYYLFYRSPAPFDRLPLHDHVVTPVDGGMSVEERRRRLAACNRSVITLNHVVHHGGIGHHVQNHYACRSASRIGQVAAVDCASRIAMFAAGTLAEGWACYATDLMEETGFLSPPDRVAQQHARVRQLARAVVDIELHQGTMTADEAEDFYGAQAGMTAQAARGEVTKNSMFPATAVMYWLGTEGLHALRHARARVEGPAFSLQRFHDRLLAYGALPVAVIADLMENEAS